MDDREQKIRELAHRIWEREGRPHGRDGEHWRLAEIEYEQEQILTHAPRGTPSLPDSEVPGLVPPIGQKRARNPGARRTTKKK